MTFFPSLMACFLGALEMPPSSGRGTSVGPRQVSVSVQDRLPEVCGAAWPTPPPTPGAGALGTCRFEAGRPVLGPGSQRGPWWALEPPRGAAQSQVPVVVCGLWWPRPQTLPTPVLLGCCGPRGDPKRGAGAGVGRRVCEPAARPAPWGAGGREVQEPGRFGAPLAGCPAKGPGAEGGRAAAVCAEERGCGGTRGEDAVFFQTVPC